MGKDKSTKVKPEKGAGHGVPITSKEILKGSSFVSKLLGKVVVRVLKI